MGRRAVVVGCPLVEMIRNVEGGWVWRGVLKVDNDDLFMGRRTRKNDQNPQSRGEKWGKYEPGGGRALPFP